MLLASARHTVSDLEWWYEAERADLVQGRTLERRGLKAIEEIKTFAANGPCYAAVSWGKDSVVIAHLIASEMPTIPIVNIWQSGQNHDPEVHRVRDAFLATWPCDYREIHVEPMRSQGDDTEKSPALTEGIKRAAKLIGTTRYIGGIRADESGVRKIRCRVGFKATCQPLRWWSAEDIFGWIASNKLPLHPAYGMTRGGHWQRQHIRVSILAGAKGNQFGRAEWEQEYYGDVLARIAASNCPPWL